jgi:hypothetical protein
MKAATQRIARTLADTWCLEEGGVLEAVRTMGEKKVKQVVVVNRRGDVVGTFRFENGRIQFETDRTTVS